MSDRVLSLGVLLDEGGVSLDGAGVPHCLQNLAPGASVAKHPLHVVLTDLNSGGTCTSTGGAAAMSISQSMHSILPPVIISLLSWKQLAHTGEWPQLHTCVAPAASSGSSHSMHSPSGACAGMAVGTIEKVRP